jgi:hypothetical protein
MINKYSCLFIITAVLFISCSSKIKNIGPKEELVKFNTLKNITTFEQLFTPKDSMFFENTSKGLLGFPTAAYIINDTTIVIKDFSSIKRIIKKYAVKGQFKCDIGNNGEGPGEYRTPVLVACSEKYIIVYDNSQSKVMLYNNENNCYLKSWSVDKQYIAMQHYNNEILMLRINNAEKEYILDYYDINGALQAKDVSFPVRYSEKMRYLPKYKIGFEVLGDNLILVSACDFICQCFNLKKEEYEWCSNELPSKVIRLEPLTNNSIITTEWAMRQPSVQGVLLFKNGLLIVRETNKLLFYDMHGNYITKIDRRSGPLFTDGEYLYELWMPKNHGYGLSNYWMKKYEFNYKR